MDRRPVNTDARSRASRGQVLPLVAILFFVAGAALVLAVAVGDRVATASRAQTAADAAALAGAAGGEIEARALAAANGATLLAFDQVGAEVQVTVMVGSMVRTARAEAIVEWRAPG